MEKKEQEVTARNAQMHQQKLSSLEDLVVTKDDAEAGTAEGRFSNIIDSFCLILICLYLLNYLGGTSILIHKQLSFWLCFSFHIHISEEYWCPVDQLLLFKYESILLYIDKYQE